MNLTKKQKVTIFIDESGTLPDPQDKIVIIATVGTKMPGKLTQVTKSTRKYLRQRDRKLDEIKFYRAGKRTKRKFLKELAKQQVEIFSLVVEKEGQKIPDTPENFALLCWFILEECLMFYENEVKEIIFDRHFHREKDQAKFNNVLGKLLNEDLKISHVNSIEDPRVNTADMAAGSLLWLKTGKDPKFYQMIKEKIIVEKTISWRNLRRKFFKEKISSNRRKRPSKRD